tara:strand:+ start:139 stop:312 length:174 start_codon:yes stop_codon:yes gene_type:complete
MNMHVYRITDVEWDSGSNEEVYFTVVSEDGIVGKIQLNMRSIIDDYSHYIDWEEKEE